MKAFGAMGGRRTCVMEVSERRLSRCYHNWRAEWWSPALGQTALFDTPSLPAASSALSVTVSISSSVKGLIKLLISQDC